MPNIASILKEEIVRLARKEMRGELTQLKKASSNHRAEIAALKRRTLALESDLKRVGKVARSSAPPEANAAANSKAIRFSAKGLASQRKRLGLSAEDVGLLVGASGQSVYNWESGTARPRAAHLPAISALKTLGKKSAAAILATRRSTS